MSSFQYDPLDKSTRSIRLLRLEEQSLRDGPICISFETHQLETAPRFNALSYTWGEPEPCHEILLNGKRFLVRDNLHFLLSTLRESEYHKRLWARVECALLDFTSRETELPTLMATLKSLTSPDRWQHTMRTILMSHSVMSRNYQHELNNDQHMQERWGIFQAMIGEEISQWSGLEGGTEQWVHSNYWLDAICINQEDDLERGHQVNFMGDIYSQAASVIAWLGPGNEGYRLATSWSPQTISRGRHSTSWSESHPRLYKYWQKTLREIPGMARSLYWKRTWTAQEFLLARELFLLHGRHTMCWYDQRPLASDILSNMFSENTSEPMYRRLCVRQRWIESTMSLDQLIEVFRGTNCQDV